MKKRHIFLPVFWATCSLLLLQGCYHYRVSTTNNDPSTTYQKKTVSSFFWGLVQKRQNGIDVVAANCDSLRLNSIDEVRVSTNFGYALITVATLGIWCPMTVAWKCPKPCQREGEIR
ncbi:hypothetical protein HRG84_23280 [Flavisolibacter sp. BT320]|nr:hypothetical protein [Flavisolibacter longurius]